MISLHASFEYREKEIIDIKFWKLEEEKRNLK